MRIRLQERPAILFSLVFCGFLALSYAVGIGPAFTSQRLSRAGLGAEPRLSAVERRGRMTYVEEGAPIAILNRFDRSRWTASGGERRFQETMQILSP